MRTIYRRGGQARKNWGTILIGGNRTSGAPQASTLWKNSTLLDL